MNCEQLINCKKLESNLPCSYGNTVAEDTNLRAFKAEQGWPNFLTRGPISRLPGHWGVKYSAIYVIYAKKVVKCIVVQ